MSGSKVAKNTAYLVAAFVGQKLLSFVYFTIVARAVGVEGSGKYVVATSLTTIFSIFTDLGLANILVRETARLPERAESLLANVLGAKTVLSLASVAVVNLVAFMMGYDADVRLMVALASVVMTLDSVHLVFYAVMRGHQDLRNEAIGVVTGQLATITAGLGFYALRLPLPYLIVALLCGSAWNVLWSWYALSRRAHVRIRLAYDVSTFRFLWEATAPFALAGIFSRVYSYLDSILLSKLAVDAATATGIYGVAYKLAFAFQFLPMAFAAAVYPAMSEYYVKDREKLASIFSTSFRYLALLVLPLAFGIASIAGPILMLVMGEQFLPATVPLQILMGSLVFGFLYWPAGSLLNACDRQGKNTLAMGATVAVNALLNMVLIPKYGAVGAAVAALVGNFTLWIVATMQVADLVVVRLRETFAAIGKGFFSAALMGAVLSLLSPEVHVVLLMPLGVVIYTVALTLSGGISRGELADLRDIALRRGKKISDIAVV